MQRNVCEGYLFNLNCHCIQGEREKERETKTEERERERGERGVDRRRHRERLADRDNKVWDLVDFIDRTI